MKDEASVHVYRVDGSVSETFLNVSALFIVRAQAALRLASLNLYPLMFPIG